MKTEKQTRANMTLEKMRTWKVINTKVKNHVGDYVGYKHLPGLRYSSYNLNTF